MKGMSQETCMIPTPEGEPRPMADSFTFVTECFFMTHRALDLGYRVVIDKLFRFVIFINSFFFYFQLLFFNESITYIFTSFFAAELLRIFQEFKEPTTKCKTVVVQSSTKSLHREWKWKCPSMPHKSLPPKFIIEQKIKKALLK